MSFRIEEKISINSQNLFDFKSFLINKNIKKIYQSRIIESLYFDNNNLDMFRESEEGIVPRKKIRIRSYINDYDKNIYLEKKISSVEGRFKLRNIISFDDSNYKKTKGIFDNNYGFCFPKLYVKYKREYYLFKKTRISIDCKIDYRDFKTNRALNDDKIIVELKTSINTNLDELFSHLPFQKIRFSKYSFGMKKMLSEDF